MEKGAEAKKEIKAKGFFGRLIEKMDRKMQEKAKKSPCGCSGDKKGDNSCCR